MAALVRRQRGARSFFSQNLGFTRLPLPRRPRRNHRDNRRRYETVGPAPTCKIITILWLHGHGGEQFEVWDDLSPFGKPGGLAMYGQIRNWVRLVNGSPKFDKDAPAETDFSPRDQEMIARAAGRVFDSVKTDSPRPDNGRTGASLPSDGPDYLQESEGHWRAEATQRKLS